MKDFIFCRLNIRNLKLEQTQQNFHRTIVEGVLTLPCSFNRSKVLERPRAGATLRVAIGGRDRGRVASLGGDSLKERELGFRDERRKEEGFRLGARAIAWVVSACNVLPGPKIGNQKGFLFSGELGFTTFSTAPTGQSVFGLDF